MSAGNDNAWVPPDQAGRATHAALRLARAFALQLALAGCVRVSRRPSSWTWP